MQLLERALSRTAVNPDEPAVIYGDIVLSWGEFFDTAGRLASLFESRNILPGQVVGMTGFSAIMQTVVLTGTWLRAGVSAILPIGFVDAPSLTPDWIITPVLLSSFPVSKQILLDEVTLQSLGNFSAQQEAASYPLENSVCHLMFSSGTTGTMKAIPYSVDRVINRARVTAMNWRTHRPFMTSLGFRSASGFNTFAEALYSGTPYFITENVEELLTAIKKFNINTLLTSPHDAALLAQRLKTESPGYMELKLIQTTGSLIPNQLRDLLSTLTGAQLMNMYGSSEVGFVAIGTPGDSETGYVGEILDDIEVEVIDTEGNPTAPGEIGELRMRRSDQPQELYKHPSGTETVFKDGWYYPGDLGFISGNKLFVKGRSTELLNAGGIKVLASELENALSNYPGISDSAVLVVQLSNMTSEIAALIVFESDVRITDLHSHMSERFGERAPTRYYRVHEVPRNANGKILRKKLEDQIPSE